MLISQASSEDNILLEITTNNKQKFYVASMYFDRTLDILNDTAKLEEYMKFARNNAMLIAVDSNCRSKTWFDIVDDERGATLEEWLFSNSLFVLNNNFDSVETTFETCRARSNIDLTLVNYLMLNHVDRWTLRGEESASDHKFISYSIYLERNQYFGNDSNITATYRYKTGKTDWVKFQQALEVNIRQFCEQRYNSSLTADQTDTKMASIISETDQIDEFVDKFMNIVRSTCDKNIPIVFPSHKRRNNKTVNWWSEELTELRKLSNKKRRSYQRTTSDSVLRANRKTEYYAIKAKYKTKLNEARLESWRKFCDATNKSQPWNYIYKAAAGKLKPQTLFTSLRTSDGNCTISIEETLNVMLDKYVPLDDTHSDNEYNKKIRQLSTDNLNYDQPDDVPFTSRELKPIIQSFDPKKTPGEDGFNQSIILQIYNVLPSSILTLYNECLKRGRFPNIWKKSLIISIVKPGKESVNEVDKYRPISLLSVWGKILEKLLINRIMFYLNKNQLLSSRQYGFTPQKNTLGAIMKVKEYVEKALNDKEVVLLIALDVKGAFDAAWWPAILVQLKNFKCPRNLYMLTLNYFSSRQAEMRANSLKINRQVSKGCPQGSCCGPGYWIIQYDSLLKEKYPAESLIVAFADDLLIAVRGKELLEAECLANTCMRTVERWSKNNKINFNSEKSNVLVVSRRPIDANVSVSVFLNNKILKIVDELKYLGVFFDSRMSWNKHISWICERSLQLTNQLSRSAKVYWGIASNALRIIYDGAFIPLLTYALPAWYGGLNRKYNMNKLRRVQRLFLLRVIKGFRTISYEATSILAGVPPIEIVAEEICQRYGILNGFDRDVFLNVDKPTELSNWMHPGKSPRIKFRVISETLNLRLRIYTDGSGMSGQVGCAFVVYLDGVELLKRQFRLAAHCSNNQAELLAIVKCLEWLVKTFSSTVSLDPSVMDKVAVLTDSSVSLDMIANDRNHMPLVEEVRRALSHLQQKNCEIFFCKVKAHIGEEGNERADNLAKEALGNEEFEESFDFAPRSYVNSLTRGNTLGKWEQWWSETEKGLTTKGFFPTVNARLKSAFEITYKMTQVLSGHGRNKAYLHRFKIIQDAACPCSQSSQTWEHIIFDCQMFEAERATMIRKLVTNGYRWPPTKSELMAENVVRECFEQFINKIDFEKL